MAGGVQPVVPFASHTLLHAHKRYTLLVWPISSSGRQADVAFVSRNEAVALLRWRALSLLRRRLRERTDRGAAWATQAGVRRAWKAWRDWVRRHTACSRVGD